MSRVVVCRFILSISRSQFTVVLTTLKKRKIKFFSRLLKKKFMFLKFFHKNKMLVLYLSLFAVAVNGYKSGAPVVACDSMTPGHNVEAQV